MNATVERDDAGFSLIELLVVIIVLGVLATVVVMSVSGIRDRGVESTEQIDSRDLHAAMEAYQAQYGIYPSENLLVSAGFLRHESERHDIVVAPDGSDYTVVVIPLD